VLPFTVSVLPTATETLSEKLAELAVSGAVSVVPESVLLSEGNIAVVDTVTDGTVNDELMTAAPVTEIPCWEVNSPPDVMPMPVLLVRVPLKVDAPLKVLVPFVTRFPVSVKEESI
jgi:hypothetical protein